MSETKKTEQIIELGGIRGGPLIYQDSIDDVGLLFDSPDAMLKKMNKDDFFFLF